jgi:hypothetical protein
VIRDNFNSDRSDNAKAREAKDDTGEFTRAFAPKKEDKPLAQQLANAARPGDATQSLAGLPRNLTGDDRFPEQADSSVPNSFTAAFDGVNAFARDLGSQDDAFKPELRKPSQSGASSAASGTFTRIFGAGEGVLTPSAPEADDTTPAPFSNALGPENTGFSVRQRPVSDSPGFTGAFGAGTSPELSRSASTRGSFSEQFDSPFLPRESPAPSAFRGGPPLTSDHFRANQNEPIALEDSPRRATEGGFTKLMSSYEEPGPRSEVNGSPDITQSLPRRSPDFNPHPPGHHSPSPPGATVVFDTPGSRPEFASTGGKSAYTEVIDGSKLRASVSTGAPLTVSAASGATLPTSANVPVRPSAFPYPPAPQPPVPPAWNPAPLPPPAPQPTIPWPHPPASHELPPAGARLVQFLPLILTLSVVNTLGLLAVVIILFATRR